MENIKSRITMKITLRRALVDTTEGQSEFQTKYCHLRMKIRMISIILCDKNVFLKDGSFKFYADRLNRI